MKRFINNNIAGLEPPRTVELMGIAAKMKAEGRDVISLVIGEPDFDTPLKIKEAAFDAILRGLTHYVPAPGIPELRKKIAEKLFEYDQVIADPESEIIVTPGAKFAIYLSLMTFLQDGDEVIVLDPSWVSYKPLVKLTGATPVTVALDPDDNYRLTREKLLPAITKKTKVMIVNSPNNPTGRVFTEEEIQILADIVAKHDILLISDEVYDSIIFDGRNNISPASISEIRDKVITINGFSKSHAMTGWRLGYLAANKELTRAMLNVHSHVVTCAPSLVQYAALAAFECQDDVKNMASEYAKRRDYLVPALNAIPGFDCRYPEGAFYAYPRVHFKGMNAMQICSYILENAGVLITPGAVYGEGGENSVRISFATSISNLEEAIRRISAVLR